MLRSRDVDVKVFGGEVESLSVAEVEGVGVRVIVDGRQGYAWAGSLDADVIAETVAEARDNAAFGAPDESYALATPADADGVDAAVLDLWRDDVCRTPTADKVALALELEAATRAADPRVRGVESASYGDAAVEAAVANSLGRRGVDPAHGRARARRSRWRARAPPPRPAAASRPGAASRELDVAGRGHATPPSARSGCSAPRRSRRRRLPVVFDPLVTRSLLALIGGALVGEAIVKGRSMFVGREGEEVAGPGHHARRRPHARRRVRRRRPTTPRACRPVASRSSPTAASTRSCTTCTPPAAPAARTTGSAVRGGFKSTPGVGARALHLEPGALERRRDPGVGARGALRAVGERPALGHQPGERRLLGRRRRARGARRRVRRAGARGHHRVDAAAHAARRRRGRRRPHLAPRWRRRA